MANYFVINSKFKPYSFDELIKPYQMYAQEYDKQEALLDAAREKEFSEAMLTQGTDAYNMYNFASKNLKEVSDELAMRGLSSNLRNKIRGTVRDYKSTMEALNTAQTKLDEERQLRRKLGPDYIYQQRDLSIDDFLNGKSPNQESRSLSTITKNIAGAFSTRAANISNTTWEKVLLNGKETGYYDVSTKQGLTNAQLDTLFNPVRWEETMNDPNITDNEKQELQGFKDIILSEMRSIGYDKYDDGYKEDIDNAILIGAQAGLGDVKHETKKDENYDPLGWARLNFEKSKAGRSGSSGKSGGRGGSGSSSSRYPLIGTLKVDKDGKTTKYPPGAKAVNGSSIESQFSGDMVLDGGVLSARNAQILASYLGYDTMENPDILMEEASRRGVIVLVKEHKNKDQQEMQISDSKSYIFDKNDSDYDDEEGIDEDAV